MGWKRSVQAETEPKQNWKFLHQMNVGLPVVLLLMVVYHIWISDCPDGDAGNMAIPCKIAV